MLTACAITADLNEPDSDVAFFKENAGLYCIRVVSGEETVKNLSRYMIYLLLSFNGKALELKAVLNGLDKPLKYADAVGQIVTGRDRGRFDVLVLVEIGAL